MTNDQNPLIYLVLGAAGSGRRTVLADLIEGGVAEGERALVLTSESEAGSFPVARTATWRWAEDHVEISPEVLGDCTHVFILTDGRRSPLDQIEAFKPWIEQTGGALARIITVVNCRLAEQQPALAPWYDACIHFSDVVLLAHRDGVTNKWISDFQARYKDRFYPCLFEFVKEGRVKNPPLLLEPETRRISHFFDAPDWDALEDEDDDDAAETEEEVVLGEATDPYMERNAGGHRLKEIPDITRFLPPQG